MARFNSSLRNPRAMLIDLSGTIHVDDHAIPNSISALKKLKDHRIPHIFVTNTSKESKARLSKRLSTIGFDIDQASIFSSLSAARSVIIERKLNPYYVLDDAALEDFSDLSINHENIDSVVVGLAPTKFNHENLSQAFNIIKDKNASLIAINKSRYFASKSGLKLGTGCFIAGLEYSADVTAEVIGKPEKAFFNAALSHLNSMITSTEIQAPIEKEEVLMVGDDIRDDVLGAQDAGFQGCLVKTGKYAAGDEDIDENRSPNYIFPSIVEVVDHIIQQ